MRSPELITPPATLPISLEEVKRHCRVDHGDDDRMIEELIASAVSRLDGYSGSLGRALITQSWRMQALPDRIGRIRFPFDPIRVVTKIAAAGEIIDPSRYAINRAVTGPWLVTLDAWRWPTSGPLTIEFDAGFGDDAASVPSDIRQAIRIDVEMNYDRPDGLRFEAMQAQYRDLVRRARRINV